MATWGSQTWGYENWGILGDITVELSGQSTTSNTGSVTVEQHPGWGTQYWGAGEWGELSSPEVALTGQEVTSNSGTLSITGDANITLTGLESTSATDGVVAGTSVLIVATNNGADTEIGSAFGGEVNVVQVNSPSDDPWGNTQLGWGNGLWGNGDGITLTGTTEIDIIGSAIAQPTSVTATGSVGDTVVPVVIDTGISMSLSQGDAFAGEVVEVQVTTASAQPWGEVGFGLGEWGQSVGTDVAQGGEEVAVPSIEVDVTGQEVTSSVANVTTQADANVSLTGIEIETLQGNEEAFSDYTEEVFQRETLQTTLGGAVAGASAEVDLVGVTATGNTGTMGINAWAVVEPNASTTWTVVDKAAA